MAQNSNLVSGVYKRSFLFTRLISFSLFSASSSRLRHKARLHLSYMCLGRVGEMSHKVMLDLTCVSTSIRWDDTVLFTTDKIRTVNGRIGWKKMSLAMQWQNGTVHVIVFIYSCSFVGRNFIQKPRHCHFFPASAEA